MDILIEYHYGNYKGVNPSLETMVSAAVDISWTREYDSREYNDRSFYEGVHHEVTAKKTGTTTFSAANRDFDCIVVEDKSWENGTFMGTDTTYYDTGEAWGGFVYSVSLDENQNEYYRITLVSFIEYETPTKGSGNGSPGFEIYVLICTLVFSPILRRKRIMK